MEHGAVEQKVEARTSCGASEGLLGGEGLAAGVVGGIVTVEDGDFVAVGGVEVAKAMLVFEAGGAIGVDASLKVAKTEGRLDFGGGDLAVEKVGVARVKKPAAIGLDGDAGMSGGVSG